MPPSILARHRQRGGARKPVPPLLVAIVGGSGSGKTWLSSKLLRGLAPHAVRLSVDDFYLDRSHLSLARRGQLNFDHPRAIDWAAVETAVRSLLAGRIARVPVYDFATHSRLRRVKRLPPQKIILLDGLWSIRRPAIRRLTSMSVFLNCPAGIRLQRRLARDVAARGRTVRSVRSQFETTVEPMHRKYVAPQARLADFVFKESPGTREVRWLIRFLRRMM